MTARVVRMREPERVQWGDRRRRYGENNRPTTVVGTRFKRDEYVVGRTDDHGGRSSALERRRDSCRIQPRLMAHGDKETCVGIIRTPREDKGVVAEFAQGDGPAIGKTMLACNAHRQRGAPDDRGDQVIGLRYASGQSDVGVAAAQFVANLSGRYLPSNDGRLRQYFPRGGSEIGEVVCGHIRSERYCQWAIPFALCITNPSCESRCCVQEGCCSSKEGCARRGEFEMTPHAFEQTDSQFSFQRLDRSADCLLREIHLVGGPGDIEMPGYGFELLDPVQIEQGARRRFRTRQSPRFCNGALSSVRVGRFHRLASLSIKGRGAPE